MSALSAVSPNNPYLMTLREKQTTTSVLTAEIKQDCSTTGQFPNMEDESVPSGRTVLHRFELQSQVANGAP